MLDLNTFCAAMSSLTCTLWVALSKLPDSALCEYQFHSIQHHLFKELIYQMRKLRFCRHLSYRDEAMLESVLPLPREATTIYTDVTGVNVFAEFRIPIAA